MSSDADREAIEALKFRYVRFLDTKQWDDLALLLTEDAQASYGGGAYVRSGREAIIEFLTTNMGSPSLHSSHRVGQPEISVSGESATGRWALNDTVIDESAGVFIAGAAFYEDTYVRVGGAWLIARTGYRRLFEYLVPLSEWGSFSLTASWWGTDGRSSLPAR